MTFQSSGAQLQREKWSLLAPCWCNVATALLSRVNLGCWLSTLPWLTHRTAGRLQRATGLSAARTPPASPPSQRSLVQLVDIHVSSWRIILKSGDVLCFCYCEHNFMKRPNNVSPSLNQCLSVCLLVCLVCRLCPLVPTESFTMGLNHSSFSFLTAPSLPETAGSRNP